MTFLDTGILVGAVLENHPEHKRCLAAFAQYRNCFSDAHALAETFATLTGFYKVPTEIATELTLDLRQRLMIQVFTLSDYETAIAEAERRGVMGGGIYDSLHATFARRKKVQRIVTGNPSHFAHVAPGIEILTP
jgi:predicted nucleic acid-binding protein